MSSELQDLNDKFIAIVASNLDLHDTDGELAAITNRWIERYCGQSALENSLSQIENNIFRARVDRIVAELMGALMLYEVKEK